MFPATQPISKQPLRRLTTPENSAGIRADFFEFYWAHLMTETSYGHVWAWVRSLLVRWPSTVPEHLAAIRWMLWAALGVTGVALVCGVLLQAVGWWEVPKWAPMLISVAVLPTAGLIARFVILRVVGDVARYLHVAPANIQRRHYICQAGVAALKALHEPARGYERVVIVGHSLGSVIGYDVLTHGWIGFNQKHSLDATEKTSLDLLEAMAVSGPVKPELVRAAQRQYFEELKANGNPWRVTDFITLGSSLAHAEIVLARDTNDLEQKQNDREFPTCLPVLESDEWNGKRTDRFSYRTDRTRKDSYRVPRHAAMFAPTRWTNLYYPSRWII